MSSFRTYILTVKRKAEGYYDTDGFYKLSGSDSQFTITASVQPITGAEMKLLPENRREEEMLKIYTDSSLRTTEQLNEFNSDIVVINNIDYEVVKSFTWQNNVINHNKYILARRVTNDNIPPVA